LSKNKGTYEWVSKTFNIFEGCKYNCSYPCYARVIRRKTEEAWKNPIFKENWFNQEISDYPKGFLANCMCFSTHDIYPENQRKCLEFILRIMNESNNSVLITSKANLKSIIFLCKNLTSFKERISFMITITTRFNEICRKFEPNAPSITERFNVLDYLSFYDWKTNVSIEPFLDKNPLHLLSKIVEKHNINSIWLGCNSRNDYSFYSFENLALIQKTINLYYPKELQTKIFLKNSFIDKLEKKKSKIDNKHISLDKFG